MKTTQETINELKQKINELEEQLKQEQVEYPICCKAENRNLVVLFSSRDKGKVLKTDLGFEVTSEDESWTPHTDTRIWKEIPYDKERNLYHGQMVYCWDDNDTHTADICFYDAINKGTFNYKGDLSGDYYDNYSATMPEFMFKAHKTLEGI